MEAISFICQLSRLTMTPDGGGKITLEFGTDALDSIQEVQKLYAAGNINLAIAVTPYEDSDT